MEETERAPDWTRRDDRKQVSVAAVAYLSDGSAHAARLENMSYEGCQIVTDITLPIGEKLKLALPRLGEISAQVRWSLQGTAGLHFLLEEARPEERRPRIPA